MNLLIKKYEKIIELLKELKESHDIQKFRYVLSFEFSECNTQFCYLTDTQTGKVKFDKFETLKSWLKIRNIDYSKIYLKDMAILIKADGKESVIILETISQMQEIIEGKVSFKDVIPDKQLIYNKDAEKMKLAFNQKASHLAEEYVYGSVILCKNHEIY